jgi:excisionase family DNA binding protein
VLNVSRPYVIGLLESGQIPFRKVGRHRRITFEALMEYKRKDDLQRRAAADDLADLSQELGLY